MDTAETVDLTTSVLYSTAATARRMHDDVDAEDPTTSDILHAILERLEQLAWMIDAENRIANRRVDSVEVGTARHRVRADGFVFSQRSIPVELIWSRSGLRRTCAPLSALDLCVSDVGGDAIDQVLRTRAATLADLNEAVRGTRCTGRATMLDAGCCWTREPNPGQRLSGPRIGCCGPQASTGGWPTIHSS